MLGLWKEFYKMGLSIKSYENEGTGNGVITFKDDIRHDKYDYTQCAHTKKLCSVFLSRIQEKVRNLYS